MTQATPHLQLMFVTTEPTCSRSTLEGWLTERGEPWEPLETGDTQCRALPLRLGVRQLPNNPNTPVLCAWLDLNPIVSLTRIVDLLFGLSIQAGADIAFVDNQENTTQANLYLHLADEQDRLRIANAIAAASERGNGQLPKRLWATLAALRPGRDDRWDTQLQRVVELKEVGAGISLDQAQALNPEVVEGDDVSVPVSDHLHIILWRWLCDAYPGLTLDSTMH